MNISDPVFVRRAADIFFRPTCEYSWNEIVRGAPVADRHGGRRTIPAVGRNTFRAFHRIDKSLPGAKEVFVHHFTSRREELLKGLNHVDDRDDLHKFSGEVSRRLVTELQNIRPDQLRAYNKVRKLVDLYFEHLVSMARELSVRRLELVPLLYLPLDSWILERPEIFSDADLRIHGTKRGMSFGSVKTEADYLGLQRIAAAKAKAAGAQCGMAFHPVYFDLFWNDRYRNWGGNLFEANP